MKKRHFEILQWASKIITPCDPSSNKAEQTATCHCQILSKERFDFNQRDLSKAMIIHAHWLFKKKKEIHEPLSTFFKKKK